MTPEKRLMTHAELVQAITAACLAAFKAGLSASEIAAVLDHVKELVETED